VELGGVLANLNKISARGEMTPSRLPELFLTVQRNRTWWTTGPLLGAGERVEFQNSELVWEYYPGQGIELQQLGSFGKANALYTAGPATHPRMLALLGELIPLAARRAGGIAWEYLFSFEGGTPPWTSAMSQGTALQALSRAYRITRNPAYLELGRQALPLFWTSPPAGASVRSARGRRYLLYSFAPADAVINGFLQALTGLYDFARVSGDPRAAQLFAAGSAEAQAELTSYDTGAWSLYQPGQEDTLSYHVLVTGFLHNLCARTRLATFCAAAQRFERYLHTPPSLQLLSTRGHAGQSLSIAFRLSKASHVGIVVTWGGQTVFLTSAPFSYGVHTFSIPALRGGSYQVRLAATDLAGNFARVLGNLLIKG